MKYTKVIFEELDQDGRYTVGDLGVFNLEEGDLEHFDTSHGYAKLTREGAAKFEKRGLKHPGLGWVKTTLITDEEADAQKEELKKSIEYLQKLLKKY